MSSWAFQPLLPATPLTPEVRPLDKSIFGWWQGPVQTSIAPAGTIFCGLCGDVNTVWFMYVNASNQAVLRISTDGGVTWGSANVKFSGVQEIPLDRALVVDPVTKTLHVFYEAVADEGLKYRRSTDGGATWSSEVSFSSISGSDKFWRISVSAYNGVVHVAYISAVTGVFTTDGLRYRRSTNDGVSWNTESQPFSAAAVNPTRPDIAHHGDIVLIGWMDSRHGTAGNSVGEIYMGRSTDGGSNFSETRLTTTPDFANLRPTLVLDHQFATIAWQYPMSAEDLWYRHSDDQGATWATAKRLVNKGSIQEHPFMEQIGEFICVIYTDNAYSPPRPCALFSRDAGRTFGQQHYIYAPTTGSAAPRLAKAGQAFILANDNAGDGFDIMRGFPIGEPQLVLRDDANRANEGPPPTGWAAQPGILTDISGGGLSISGRQFISQAGLGYRQGSRYSPTFAADVEVGIRLTKAIVAASSDGFVIFARVRDPGPTTVDAYAFVIEDTAGTLDMFIWRLTNNTNTGLANAVGVYNANVGEIFVLRCLGPEITAWQKQDNSPSKEGPWWRIFRVIDTVVTGQGQVGIEILNETPTVDDLFARSLGEEGSIFVRSDAFHRKSRW